MKSLSMDRIGGNPAAPTCTAVMGHGCRRRRDTAAVTPATLLTLFRQYASPRQPVALAALKWTYHAEVTEASFSAVFLTMARIASTSSTSRTLVNIKGRGVLRHTVRCKASMKDLCCVGFPRSSKQKTSATPRYGTKPWLRWKVIMWMAQPY